jgi:sugar fermentation stimulation protein A
MVWTPVIGFDPMKGPPYPSESADYLLLLYIDKENEIEVGALGSVVLKIGTYAYCGSAKAGLWGRVKRHLSDPVKKRWHIDHITPFSSEKKIFYKGYLDDGECRTAKILSIKNEGVKGFGCSDCKCGSHLFYMGEADLTSR